MRLLLFPLAIKAVQLFVLCMQQGNERKKEGRGGWVTGYQQMDNICIRSTANASYSDPTADLISSPALNRDETHRRKIKFTHHSFVYLMKYQFLRAKRALEGSKSFSKSQLLNGA